MSIWNIYIDMIKTNSKLIFIGRTKVYYNAYANLE